MESVIGSLATKDPSTGSIVQLVMFDRGGDRLPHHTPNADGDCVEAEVVWACPRSGWQRGRGCRNQPAPQSPPVPQVPAPRSDELLQFIEEPDWQMSWRAPPRRQPAGERTPPPHRRRGQRGQQQGGSNAAPRCLLGSCFSPGPLNPPHLPLRCGQFQQPPPRGHPAVRQS